MNVRGAMSSKLSVKAQKELRILHLIALGLDVRVHTKRAELQKSPTLMRALKALDELQSEIGWKEWDSKTGAKRRRKT